MKRFFAILFLTTGIILSTQAQSSGFKELDEQAAKWKEGQSTYFGYPVNQRSELTDFYRWYTDSGLDLVNLNNAGDPMTGSPWKMSSHRFEREVIEFFAPLYGFKDGEFWGIVTHSGTDGNNHGIYFGAKSLFNKTGKMPVMYVSDEAHYSNMRLADLQNLELRLIKSDIMGRMDACDFEQQLDTTRPALVVFAMGSTFKGAVDDMQTINGILDRHPELPGVYRHLDAALFGGYLPFTRYRDLVNSQKQRFDSISVSGHKFFGIDSPSGLFLCTRSTYDSQNSFNVPYLNNDMKMINCSRDAIQPLKFWWLIKKVGKTEWESQANRMLECTEYLDRRLSEIGWPHWVNRYSNTVFFRRPSESTIYKYLLAGGHDDRFGGDLNHIVVMQQLSHEAIDGFISDLSKEPIPEAPSIVK